MIVSGNILLLEMRQQSWLKMQYTPELESAAFPGHQLPWTCQAQPHNKAVEGWPLALFGCRALWAPLKPQSGTFSWWMCSGSGCAGQGGSTGVRIQEAVTGAHSRQHPQHAGTQVQLLLPEPSLPLWQWKLTWDSGPCAQHPQPKLCSYSGTQHPGVTSTYSRGISAAGFFHLR